QPERNTLLQVGVFNLFLLAILPGGDHLLACSVIHRDAASILFAKTRSLYLPAVNQRQYQAISKNGTQLFHEVKCQTGPPRPIRVEKSDRRVQSDTFQS